MGGNTKKARDALFNMYYTGEKNPFLYDGMINLNLKGITTPLEAKAALEHKMMAADQPTRTTPTVPKKTVQSLIVQAKSLMALAEEPVIRPDKAKLRELRVVVDGARYRTESSGL